MLNFVLYSLLLVAAFAAGVLFGKRNSKLSEQLDTAYKNGRDAAKAELGILIDDLKALLAKLKDK